jgi:NADH-quinone oxidoreductase subunit L
MLFLIPALPFAGFLVNAGVGRRLSKSASGAIAVGAMTASFAVSLFAVYSLFAQPSESPLHTERLFNWITSGDFVADLTFALDPLSSLMSLVVTGIGLLIHVYSTAYMHEERAGEYARYFSYLNLFAAFMLVLVLGANFLVMFVGWEGVGLSSYLLIGFWYAKKSAADAGKKAFIMNRVGDAGFVLGVLLLFVRFGTIDFQQLARASSSLSTETTFGAVSLGTLLLVVGATGKSAQIPLFVWLPDAMEGPTPVSALIHAATMVTAGVYMIGRNAALFSHAPITMTVVAVIGVATALLAATIALVQNDIKRVLAYSTISQLGFMFLAMGIGAYGAGIFHLFTHAFFKALLFLGAGAVIHALHGEQDLRRMGGLRQDLPLTYWTFLVGALAIAGVPGLAGFFSKDEILFRTYAGDHQLLWAVGLATSLLTAAYMFRVVFLAFHGDRRHAVDEPPAQLPATSHAPEHLHDAPRAMAFALVVLAIGSILAGYVNLPEALGGSGRLLRSLQPSFQSSSADASAAREAAAGAASQSPLPTAQNGIETETHERGEELALMGVSSVTALAGIGFAVFFFLKRPEAAKGLADRFAPLRTLLVHKYYVDELYDSAIVEPIRVTADRGLWRGIDIGIIDSALDGLGVFLAGLGEVVRRIQTGSVRAYAASLLAGVVLVLGYYLLR